MHSTEGAFDDTELPNLKSIFRLGPDLHSKIAFYDVKFYPFAKRSEDPVFAAVGGQWTVVCRPSKDSKKPMEVLRWFNDDDEGAALNSLCWTKDPSTGNPIVCVSGAKPKIKLLDVITGKLIGTFTGHGAAINDLAVCPVQPAIIGSVSEDFSIRLWDLRRDSNELACVAILGGELPRAPQSTMAWHQSGKYIISGGQDTRIFLWAPPTEVYDEKSSDGILVDAKRTIMVRTALFTTSEVHHNYVDCVAFYGDLIVSHAVTEARILIWRIIGFSSDRPAPPSDLAPAGGGKQTHAETRSSFSDMTETGGFQLLMTLHTPENPYAWVHFGLYHQPNEHPILAIGNTKRRFFFWDLELIEQGNLGVGKKARAPSHRGKAKAKALVGSREESVMSSSSTGNKATNTVIADSFGGPFEPLKAHKVIDIPISLDKQELFVLRAMSWSTCGKWCVGVADFNTLCVFHR